MKLMRVPCAAIKPDAQGTGCGPDAGDELVESIRDKGLLRPILVREAGDGYVIVHGERRWRAVQALGHVTIAAWLVLDLLHRSSGAL